MLDMRGVGRVLVVGMVVALAMLPVAGCGGGGGRGVVASFAGRSLSRAVFDHWVRIEAVIEDHLWAQQPPPAGEIPDPPTYTACMTYQRSLLSRYAKPTTGQLKGECERRYQHIWQHMLQLLIGYWWTETEARAHGINISPQELHATYQRYNHETFPTEAALQNYLKATGVTPADQLTMVRFDMQLTALREKIMREGGIPEIKRFYHTYPHELAAKTSCSPGYVIPECEQYKGPETPHG